MRAIRGAEAYPPIDERVVSNELPPVAAPDREQQRVASLPLWIGQGVLALIFLFAGGMKLALPLDVLTAQFPLPGEFVRFVGVCELLGAIGLILPGYLRIRSGLTPLAATGLVLVMIGATTLTLAMGQGAAALIPFIVGVLAAFVAYGRWPTIHTLFD
ncbi:MAG TPA: DoxX family protein [Chloroflexota bacterium]|nr:DoxX family protein [Chloroflexota bacterium]